MTNRAIRMTVVLWAGFALQAAAGTGPEGPERLGAHWARVPDRAQVEFLIDGLRSARPGSPMERIMLRNARAGEGLSLGKGSVRSDASAVNILGDAALVSFTGGEEVRLARTAAGWRTVAGTVPAIGAAGASTVVQGGTGFSAGSTFIDADVSTEHGINRLSKAVTREKLGRALFSTPGPSASYYSAHYMQSAPYVSASYVQFVVDRSWNRIVYGNLNRWIKSYDNLVGPSSIAVDPSGRVYVGETGREQVAVLRLEGEGNDAQLRTAFTIPGIASPSALAHNDNGTPLDPTDDVLYVADAVRNVVLKYSLGPAGAVLTATFEGFDSPNAVAVGRWNGANTNLLYVVDNVAKRVRVMEDAGTSLATVAEYRGGYNTYFSCITTDHFGNVYLADNTNARLSKLSSALEFLDEEGGPDVYAALSAVDIPFGLITVDGQGTYWAGFDQLFAVERWSESSGARRRVLGLKLKDIVFTTDQDASTIAGRFILTDFGVVGARVYDAGGTLVRTLRQGGMIAGHKEIVWDRRSDAGSFVPPGEYRYELAATSPYRDETVTAAARWTLPLYYEEHSGLDDQHLIQGTAVSSGGVNAVEHNDAVRYRFTGLRPAGSYAVAAEYVAPDGTSRLQDMTAGNGVPLHQPLLVGASLVRVDFVPVPPSAFASGELILSVNRRGAGTAVVSRLVLKETGTGFTSQPDEKTLPVRYALEQNFPNPFNPSTIIRYALPEGGPVSLTVFDIAGREVARLVNETQPAGTYQVRFDAAAVRRGGVASGVYFYRVQAGSFNETRKMLLVK